MIRLKQLINEAGDYTAKSKESGKLVHFKNKDSYDAAIKAGSHEDPTADSSKDDNKKGGVNIFNTPAEPTTKPKNKRGEGNPAVNTVANKLAEKAFGFTPQKLGKEKFREVMLQSAVKVLKFKYRREARELVAALEEKPEFAKRVDYPNDSDPKYDEKMDYIKNNTADGSIYMNTSDDVQSYSFDVLEASKYFAPDAVDAIANTLRINGFGEDADLVQSVLNPNNKEKKNENKKMESMKLKELYEAETFTATNKASGKTSVFKSKGSRDAAIKAGTHDAKKDSSPNGDKAAKGSKTPKVNIFDKPSKSEPKSDTPKATPADLAVDKVVYNTRTKSVGIVRMADERGETKTDADGNVNSSELEPYNPMKYPHQKDAKVAPSTQKEVDSRGLWNPFSTNEPTSNSKVDSIVSRIQKAYDNSTDKKKDIEGLKSQLQTWKEIGADDKKDQIEAGEKFLKSIEGQTKSEPKAQRKGDPAVNKEVRKIAQKMGISSDKMDKNEYQKKMAQAAVAALTDSNFHQEARELVAALEGKPEMAEKPDYPSMKDPKYKEKMDVIRAKYDSVYSSPDDDAEELGTAASQAAGWSGDTAIDGIAFELRMNGFHKLADKIQSVIKEGKSNRTSLKNLMK